MRTGGPRDYVRPGILRSRNTLGETHRRSIGRFKPVRASQAPSPMSTTLGWPRSETCHRKHRATRRGCEDGREGAGQRMDLELKDKICVVTGASKGIGLAITRALVAEGATVVAGART